MTTLLFVFADGKVVKKKLPTGALSTSLFSPSAGYLKLMTTAERVISVEDNGIGWTLKDRANSAMRCVPQDEMVMYLLKAQ